MHHAPCNKCKGSRGCDGGSWCLGCSSLEVAQNLFRKKWLNQGVRAVAEEAALSAARFIMGLSQLDSSLSGRDVGGRSLLTSAKSKAERPQTRSPRREPEDRCPPLLRAAPSRERPRAREEDRRPPEEYSYAEGSEKEEACEEEIEARPEVKEAPALERRRPEKLPEPRHPLRGASRGKGKKRKRRGGSKHQRHYREREDPLRTSHRKLGKSRLEFAPDLRSGLERRA